MSLAVLILFVTIPVFARQKTDVMVMKNGDRMTCEIKGLDAGVLYVSFDYIDGTASVDWSKVARLESVQPFIVTTEDGSVYRGMLRTSETGGGPVKIQVLESSERATVIDRPRIVQMIASSDNFFQRFSGDVGFGVIYSKGNQSTQYSLASHTAYIRQRWIAQANFSSNLSSSTGSTASTRNSLDLGVRRLLRWNNWFYEGAAGLLQSSEQGINLQSTFGAGIGRYLENSSRASISLLGGMAWQNTHYRQSNIDLNNENIAAAMIAAQARLFKFSKTNLDLTASLLPALSDPGRLRFNTDAAYYIKLVSNLKWNISLYGNWDTRPPLGLPGSDYGTSAGLTWTFGLK